MVNNDDRSTRERLVNSFFSGTGSSYDTVAKILTFGLDNYWKAEIVKLVPDSERILDLGCGTGILTESLAREHPRSEIVGVDITADYLAAYDERLKRNPWIKARSILGNAETVALEGEFDAIVSSYLAKYVDPDMLVRNVTPHLRKGGAFIVHDFVQPTNRLYLASWLAYTGGLNHLGPFLFPEWRNAFADGFGLVRRTNWIDTFTETLMRHGYAGIHSRRLSFQTAGLLWATKS